MKKIILGLMMLGSFSSYAATTLFCSAEYGSIEDEVYYHLGLKGKAILNCSTVKIDMNSSSGIAANKKYRVEITNVGLGVFGAETAETGAGLTIICPTVRSKALGVSEFSDKRGNQKKGAMNFYGVRTSAAFFLGADAAVFANKKGGVCVLAGLSVYAGGASVSGSKMTVTLKN